MTTSLIDAGKRYNYHWIFRHCNFVFQSAKRYAVVGPNGSGKSTLLQTIAGNLLLSEGKIIYSDNEKEIDATEVYKYISLCTPYLELVEEMTLTEFLDFHFSFKKILPNISVAEIITAIGLNDFASQRIATYSSGMKQRVKLAQSIFSDTKILLLDEPCTNLDEKGTELYHTLINKFCTTKTIIVASNNEREYSFCEEKILVSSFKF